MTYDLIIVAGAPGSGKTTLAKGLSTKLDSPNIDFGALREFHLDTGWKRQHPDEEAMAFENLLAIIENYRKHGYGNVVVHDLRDNRVVDLAKKFPKSIVLTLVPNDGALEERVHSRTEGWRDIPGAIVWNDRVKARAPLANEYRIDNSQSTPEDVCKEALALLKKNG